MRELLGTRGDVAGLDRSDQPPQRRERLLDVGRVDGEGPRHAPILLAVADGRDRDGPMIPGPMTVRWATQLGPLVPAWTDFVRPAGPCGEPVEPRLTVGRGWVERALTRVMRRLLGNLVRRSDGVGCRVRPAGGSPSV